jgi:hypothetical protein
MRSGHSCSSDFRLCRKIRSERLTPTPAEAPFIQDLGYDPFGSRDFSNLVHYVRSKDFVREVLWKASMSTSMPSSGHPAVNHAVAIQYPKLRDKFGQFVRHAQDKTAQLKMEFGFDTVQVVKNRYASQQYHDFIGFRVSKSRLEVNSSPLNVVLNHLALPRNPKVIRRCHEQITHLLDLIRRTVPFSSRPAPPAELPCYERFPRC